MTNPYDLNAHLHCGDPRPLGALPATVKTPHAITAHPSPRTKVHRPVYAVTAYVNGRYQIGARFACGSASANVRPVSEAPHGMDLCAKCEQAAEPTTPTFYVYGYYDRDAHLLYVGQTNDLDARHRGHSTARLSSEWFHLIDRREVLSQHDTRGAALQAEAEVIAQLRPRFNRQRPLHLLGGAA